MVNDDHIYCLNVHVQRSRIYNLHINPLSNNFIVVICNHHLVYKSKLIKLQYSCNDSHLVEFYNVLH